MVSGGKPLWGLWVDGKGERGWAVGGSGVVLSCDGKEWTRDAKASAVSGGQHLRTLWLDSKGERSWAVGASGVVLDELLCWTGSGPGVPGSVTRSLSGSSDPSDAIGKAATVPAA